LAQDVSETCESFGENTIIELIADCQDDGERSRRKRNVSPLATVGVDFEMQIEMFSTIKATGVRPQVEQFQPTMRL
jgi:N-methylhydantoinase B/oxoprolinase/acetone carboxylase alpha subunit